MGSGPQGEQAEFELRGWDGSSVDYDGETDEPFDTVPPPARTLPRFLDSQPWYDLEQVNLDLPPWNSD